MSDFKRRHFEGEVVLQAVRWYCRYGISKNTGLDPMQASQEIRLSEIRMIRIGIPALIVAALLNAGLSLTAVFTP